MKTLSRLLVVCLLFAGFSVELSAREARPQAPADSSCWARGMGLLRQQLAGACYFDTPCEVYFVQACREFSFPKACLIAIDRRLRCNRIGMAGRNSQLLDADGHMHETLDAYRYRRQLPLKATPPALHLDYSRLLDTAACGRPQAYFSEDYDFAQYLLSLKLKQEAQFLIDKEKNYYPSDSLYFMRAWVHYLQKDLELAAANFSLVDSCSVFHDKALFYQTALLAHLGCYAQADSCLASYRGEQYAQLQHLQGAGLALLRNDMDAYRQEASCFDTSHRHYLSTEQSTLQTMFEERLKLTDKNPWLAASLSAVVPGLGKVYAGNLSEGVMSFLMMGISGALTAEHIIKLGPQDWRSITFASLTGILYVSNIFGSYFSVQILQDHVLQKQTQAILYHIHMPLDRIFR